MENIFKKSKEVKPIFKKFRFTFLITLLFLLFIYQNYNSRIQFSELDPPFHENKVQEHPLHLNQLVESAGIPRSNRFKGRCTPIHKILTFCGESQKEKPRCTTGTAVKSQSNQMKPCVWVVTAVPVVNRGFSFNHSQNHRGESGQIYDNPKFLSKVQNSQWRLGEWNGLSEASQTPSYGPVWSLGRNARSKSQSRDNERFIRS